MCEDDNIETIKKLTGITIIGVIRELNGVDVEEQKIGNVKKEFKKRFSVSDILASMDEL